MTRFTMEQLFSLLPLTGQWFLRKTSNDDVNMRHRATWKQTVGAHTQNIAVYGATPYDALRNLVIEINGPLETIEKELNS